MRRTSLLLLFLFWLPAAQAGTIDPVASHPGYSVAADYSWTELLSLEDPANLNSLTQLANSLGPNVFLSTGNTAYNYQSQQLLVVGASQDEALIPEPRSLLLFGVGLVLAARRK